MIDTGACRSSLVGPILFSSLLSAHVYAFSPNTPAQHFRTTSLKTYPQMRLSYRQSWRRAHLR